jgi:hypothetical protein
VGGVVVVVKQLVREAADDGGNGEMRAWLEMSMASDVAVRVACALLTTTACGLQASSANGLS